MITREFDLMLYQEGNLLFINANQYDSGEQWIFTLYEENGVKYTPATGAIVGVKSDGKGIINTGTVDEYGRVVINETQQMTAAAGLATFELLIDNDTHGTANFKVDVEPRPADNADLSDSDLSLIQEAIDSAKVIVEVIGDSDPSEVIGEHVDAWLDTHPEATTTVLDGAITAPKINSTLWDKLLVSEEASGSVASFDDGADGVPVKSLIAHINPVQSGSGDPSPTNVRPITGHTSASVLRTGKNLIDNKLTTSTSRNVTATVNADKSVYLNGTASSSGYFTMDGGFAAARAELLPWMKKDGTTFIMSGGNGQQLIFYTEDGTSLPIITVDSGEFTIPNDAVYYGYFIRIQNGTAYDRTIYPMIRLASVTDATYEPYQGQTVTIDLNGTVYGGTLDVLTGVLTVDMKKITLTADMNWQYSSATDRFFVVINDAVAKSGDLLFAGMCNMFKSATGNDDNSVSYINQSANGFAIKHSVLGGSLTAWKQFITNNTVEVVYPLATPQTVQLTPTQVKTLLGYNSISSSGTVDVIYHADTKLYVDKMTAVDNAIIAPTEADFIATSNYTVNDLLIVADTLYKVTANIASGSAITPNSNVTATTLSALIKALS